MRFVKIPAIVSTVPDLSCVVICKQHRENRETISIAKQHNFSVFWLSHYISVCVCDVTIAPRIASTAANKLR